MLERSVIARGGDVFFRAGERRYSLSDTQTEVRELADRLAGCDIGPGDMLAVDLPNCAEFVFVLFAAASLG
ncbi:MAG: AMP-binding ligase, partial [Actinobacteria bacterium 66_15]